MGPVFGVDRQLIRDRTFFVVENEGALIGCGGWSRRRSLFGSNDGSGEPGPVLDPKSEPARIRAFFIHPDWVRKGIARNILAVCEREIREAGFQRIELVATLPGEPLYLAFGWSVTERFNIALRGGLGLPVVRMCKLLAPQMYKKEDAGKRPLF
jgi:GNAT superfamily N-acetyltransferase